MITKDYLLEDISIQQQTAPRTSGNQTDETLIKLLAKLCERHGLEKENKKEMLTNSMKILSLINSKEEKRVQINGYIHMKANVRDWVL